MISSRLLLSINRLPAKDVLACLEELDRAGAAHAYRWFSRSLIFLLFAVLLSVYLQHLHAAAFVDDVPSAQSARRSGVAYDELLSFGGRQPR